MITATDVDAVLDDPAIHPPGRNRGNGHPAQHLPVTIGGDEPVPRELRRVEGLPADQLGHSSVVLTADTYLSVAIELGLKGAAAAARLILSHAGRPPGGGTTRRPSAPPQAIVTGRTASPDTLAA
jgi:hypothetical protein